LAADAHEAWAAAAAARLCAHLSSAMAADDVLGLPNAAPADFPLLFNACCLLPH
jgi:hypothetical protein